MVYHCANQRNQYKRLKRYSKRMYSKISRISLILSALFYAAALNYSHIVYLNPIWGYFGFTYNFFEWPEIAFALFLAIVVAFVLPTKLERPSCIIILLLFVVVYIPTIVITLGLNERSIARYGVSLLMLSLAFVVVCLVNRSTYLSIVTTQMPGKVFNRLFLCCWLVMFIILLYNFSSIMKLSGLDDVYEQRAAGTSTNIIIGYIQTYFSNVFSPGLISLGLVLRKRWFILIGCIGCLAIYMITAQRTVFLLPIVIIGLNYVLKSTSPTIRSSAFLIFLLSITVIFCSLFYVENDMVSFLSTYIIFRTLAVPGLTFSQYFDVFGTYGLTWWSHIKGIDLLIAAPDFFAQHQFWPQLGRIVGDTFYDNAENNVNANLFSSDGVAAAGSGGVLLIGVVAAVWLKLLDWAARGWDKTLVILLTVPLGLTLTNGPLATTLLSFGGLFWIAIFYFCKPSAQRIQKVKSKRLIIK